MKNRVNLLLLILLMLSCKKPFNPSLNISDDKKYLVVEGVIVGNDSTFIKISRTKKVDTLRTVFPESSAQVNVESDANDSFNLAEIRPGTYAVAALNLSASHKYRLRIKTFEGKEYLSDFVTVKNAPPIDSIGFAALPSGVHIYVNTHDDSKNTRFYRWEYTENWQFHAEYISTYRSNGVDSLKPRKASEQVYDCFGGDTSGTVLIASTAKLTQDNIYKAPVADIPANSEKIEKKYSILVKQFALTSDAYQFWENLQRNTEKLGSIFDVLPSETQSNFHCVTNPNELVVGYLSAGNVSYKRIFITTGQLLPSYKPEYPFNCGLDTAFLNPPHGGTLPIGDLVPANSPYFVISALYLYPPNPFGLPTAYTYTNKLCGDCTVRGVKNAPSFWR